MVERKESLELLDYFIIFVEVKNVSDQPIRVGVLNSPTLNKADGTILVEGYFDFHRPKQGRTVCIADSPPLFPRQVPHIFVFSSLKVALSSASAAVGNSVRLRQLDKRTLRKRFL